MAVIYNKFSVSLQYFGGGFSAAVSLSCLKLTTEVPQNPWGEYVLKLDKSNMAAIAKKN